MLDDELFGTPGLLEGLRFDAPLRLLGVLSPYVLVGGVLAQAAATSPSWARLKAYAAFCLRDLRIANRATGGALGWGLALLVGGPATALWVATALSLPACLLDLLDACRNLEALGTPAGYKDASRALAEALLAGLAAGLPAAIRGWARAQPGVVAASRKRGARRGRWLGARVEQLDQALEALEARAAALAPSLAATANTCSAVVVAPVFGVGAVLAASGAVYSSPVTLPALTLWGALTLTAGRPRPRLGGPLAWVAGALAAGAGRARAVGRGALGFVWGGFARLAGAAARGLLILAWGLARAARARYLWRAKHWAVILRYARILLRDALRKQASRARVLHQASAALWARFWGPEGDAPLTAIGTPSWPRWTADLAHALPPRVRALGAWVARVPARAWALGAWLWASASYTALRKLGLDIAGVLRGLGFSLVLLVLRGVGALLSALPSPDPASPLAPHWGRLALTLRRWGRRLCDLAEPYPAYLAARAAARRAYRAAAAAHATLTRAWPEARAADRARAWEEARALT